MRSGFARNDEVRRSNRRRVIAAVRRLGPISRTDIGKETGLSAATVSTISSDLIAEQVLISPDAGERPANGRGRPRVKLAVNPDAAFIGVVMYLLNHVSAAIINYAGETVTEVSRSLPTLDAEREAVRAGLETCLAQAIEEAGGVSLARIAVGVQGVTDIGGTELLWSPVTKERHLPIAEWFDETFGVPTAVSNDCDLMARALNWRDPAHYGVNFAAVLLSYGVGMGLFLRGAPVNGTRSSATEFGHMTYMPGGALCRCGRFGCIEAYAGDYAIGRAARGEPDNGLPPGDSNPDIAAIAAAARAGDKRAARALEAAGEALGTGLAGLYALVDPFPVALIGSGTVAFDLIERPLRDALGRTVGGGDASDIEIDCYPDEKPLVCEGCAVSALASLDDQFAATALEAETL